MMNYRSLARHLLTLSLTLFLSGCLNDSSNSDGLSLEITGPSSLSAIDTTDPAISLSGTAGSENGILQISWANDRGGEGIADGTDSWQTESIALELGENTITVTAEGTTGETANRIIVINRESGENGSATLSWNAPTSRVDGTPLANLAGYKLYYGRMSGIYDYEIEVGNPGVLTYVVEGLVSGDWYFTLAAYDAEGLESELSNEVLREIS